METPKEVVAQAIEQGLVSNWQYPEVVEVFLTKTTGLSTPIGRLGEVAEPSLSFGESEPEPSHFITHSGIKIYDDLFLLK